MTTDDCPPYGIERPLPCDADTLEPDEYDRALYRIESADRLKLAETLGRVRLESPAY